MSHITLHKELGVNPRLTYCPQCGGESNELLLLGNTNKVYRCEACNTPHIGRPKRGKCMNCGHGSVPFERELDRMEKLPGSICDSCQEKNAAVAEEVAKGGIHWRCSDCGSAGAIKAGHPLAVRVREQMGIEPPDPCGIEFSKEEMCPVCSEDKV
jgi:rubrerythrin